MNSKTSAHPAMVLPYSGIHQRKGLTIRKPMIVHLYQLGDVPKKFEPNARVQDVSDGLNESFEASVLDNYLGPYC